MRYSSRALVATLATSISLAMQCCLPRAGYCHPAPVPAANAGTAASSPQSINYNLSSTHHSLLDSHLAAGTVNIDVGGHSLAVTNHTHLTPAEMVAVTQVLNTGHQQIELGAAGSAIGGLLNLSSDISSTIGNLIIPHGVTALNNFAVHPTLSIAGELSNSGSLLGYSSKQQLGFGTILADNIFNQSGGLISTALPAGSQKLLALADNSSSGWNASSVLGLDLAATHNILNHGSIISSASLSLSAGGQFENDSGARAVTALVEANNNIAILASSITNTGSVSSLTGNININGYDGNSMSIAASGGTFSALQGAINIGDGSSRDLMLSGGNYLSQTFNVDIGSGNLAGSVDTFTGTVNVTASTANLGTVSGNSTNLSLGNISLTGDPTFYNDATNGDITIRGNITVGESLTIIASRNILSSGNFTLRANDGSNGCDINLIAGANVSSSGSASTTDVSSTLSGAATHPVVISGPSNSGGNIDFSNNNMAINTAAVAANGSGGNVRLIAYQGQSVGGGNITLSADTSIITGGNGNGANGNVIMISGAANGTLSTGSINTMGGTGSGGNVSIINAQPQFTSGSSITFGTNGAISSGNDFSTSAGTILSNPVLVNNSIVASGTITIDAGGDISAAAASSGAPSGTSSISSPSLIGTVPAAGWPGAIACDPNGPYTYVANATGSTVSVIDTSNNTQVALIPVGGASNAGPVSITFDPAGHYAYVACRNANNIAVIDTSSKQVVDTLSMPANDQPSDIAINSSGSYAYVANSYNNVAVLSLANPSSPTLVTSIPIPYNGNLNPSPQAIVLNSAGTYAYVANNNANTVSVINTSSYQLSTVFVGQQPDAITINPAGTYVYVANTGSNNISVINTNSLAVSSVAVGYHPISIAMNPAGTYVYVANRDDNNVSILSLSNPGTPTPAYLEAVGNSPNGVAVNNLGTEVFSANTGSNNITELAVPGGFAGFTPGSPGGSLASSGAISLTSLGGNIGTAAAPIPTAAGSLSFNTTAGSSSVFVNQAQDVSLLNSSVAGALNLNINGNLNLDAGTAVSAGTVSITALGNMIVSGSISSTIADLSLTSSSGSISVSDLQSAGAAQITANNAISLGENLQATGSISVNGAGPLTVSASVFAGAAISLVTAASASQAGVITISPGAIVCSSNSTVLIQSLDTANGGISIASGDYILSNGNISILIGQASGTPISGSVPSGISLSQLNGGQAFFGSKGLSAALPENTIVSDSYNVYLENNSSTLPDSAISLAGGTLIDTRGGLIPGGRIAVNSLDLTNRSVVSELVLYQTLAPALVGGTLQVNSDGMASGGTLILVPADLTAGLLAENIPAGVTVTFSNFQAGNQTAVSIGSASQPCPPVVINGTEEFVSSSGTSNAIINVYSNPQDTALTVNGKLSSDGNLAVSVAGGIEAGGTLTSLGDTTLKTMAGSNASIRIDGGTVGSSGVTSISADGAGIIQQDGGSLTGTTISLQSASGAIGVQTDVYASSAISLLSAGNITVAILQSPLVSLQSTAGNITANGSISAFAIAGAGGQVNINAAGSINLASDGIDITANGPYSGPAGQVNLKAGASIVFNGNTPLLSANSEGSGAGGEST